MLSDCAEARGKRSTELCKRFIPIPGLKRAPRSWVTDREESVFLKQGFRFQGQGLGGFGVEIEPSEWTRLS